MRASHAPPRNPVECVNVYKENVSRIGLLEPPLPRLIAIFYTQANAILEDLEILRDQSNREFFPPEVLLRAYEQLLQLFEDTMTVGGQALSEISRKYK